MLATMEPPQFNWLYDGFGTISTTTPGTSVVPGATNAEGAWTQIATAANIAQHVYSLDLWITGANVTTADKSQLLDIGVDPAGGTAYQAILTNICCGSSGFSLDGGYQYRFPIFIKAGSTVAARVQGSNGTAGTVRIAAMYYGMLSNKYAGKFGRYSETIGAITNSGGVSFTPSNAGGAVTWTSLGTTTRNLWWFQLCPQISNGTITALIYWLHLAYGTASHKQYIVKNLRMYVTGTVEKVNLGPQDFGYREVPAGATLYVAGTCSGTAVTGFNATAVGIGG